MRARKKPSQSWIERSKYEIDNTDRLLAERQKQLKKIRKKKNNGGAVMKTTDFSNASAAFVDLSQLLNDKKYFEVLKKRKNKANSRGRMRRVQTILIECNSRILAKQIIHYRFC